MNTDYMYRQDSIIIKVAPRHIAFVNWIMQGYEHVGVVSALDAQAGILLISATPDFMNDVRSIVGNFGFPAEIVAEAGQL